MNVFELFLLPHNLPEDGSISSLLETLNVRSTLKLPKEREI